MGRDSWVTIFTQPFSNRHMSMVVPWEVREDPSWRLLNTEEQGSKMFEISWSCAPESILIHSIAGQSQASSSWRRVSFSFEKCFCTVCLLKCFPAVFWVLCFWNISVRGFPQIACAPWLSVLNMQSPTSSWESLVHWRGLSTSWQGDCRPGQWWSLNYYDL